MLPALGVWTYRVRRCQWLSRAALTVHVPGWRLFVVKAFSGYLKTQVHGHCASSTCMDPEHADVQATADAVHAACGLRTLVPRGMSS